MPYKNGNIVYNETVWTPGMLIFLKENYHTMSNQQLANSLGLRLTTTRTKLYELGLKRMDMQYWTDEQVLFLKENYKTVGDTVLAEIFSTIYYKEKGWTKKHIEKKRRYLKLKRTEKELIKIKEINVINGRWAESHWKRWFERVSPIGEVRVWMNSDTNKPFKVIKTAEGFVHYAPWLFQQYFGPVPKGMIVRLLDEDPLNVVLENLTLVTRAEHSMLNAGISIMALNDSYIAGILSPKNPELKKEILKHPELINLKRKQLILTKQINQHGKRQ